MKIENQSTDIIKIGETASKQATISQHKLSKLQYILTKGLYSDPITAVIAEITNNGIDAVVQAGKDPKKHPVTVEINKDAYNNWYFRVTDKGIGLNKEEFENILMNYLESTKEDDDNSIGFFGLGSKSFLSLERTATFTCRKNGREWKFLAYQSEEFCEYDLISETDTAEENGVIFEIPLNSYYEASEFNDKAMQKLAYYDTVAYFYQGKLQENSIIRSKDWQYSSENTDTKLHLCLKDVYYQIDFTKLGIGAITMPIALRFGLKDGIAVTPSRENIIYTEKVKKLILDKIKATADWFVKKYNENTLDEYETIMEVWDYMTHDSKYVKINDVDFTVNPLMPYSNLIPKFLKVKGISLRNLGWYKTDASYILSNYLPVTFKRPNGNFKSHKRLLRYQHNCSRILEGQKVVLVNSSPLGYLRKYLRQKYKNETCTIIIKKFDRKLGWADDEGTLLDGQSYYDILNLGSFVKTKKDWRAHIQEFQRVEKEFKDKIVDETAVEDTQEFKDWLVQHKQFLKLNQNHGSSSSSYKTLNKQADEMTISIGRESSVKDGPVFEKQVFKIKDLHKQPCLFLLFNDKETAEKYWLPFNIPPIKFCMIGKKEINKLPLFKSEKFIKFVDFMTRDCKPFQRIASAILFSKTVEDFKQIQTGRKELFDDYLSPYMDSYKIIAEYVKNNLKNTGSQATKDAILEVAVEKDLFDKEFWADYVKLKNAVEKLDFFTCFKSPASFDVEEVKKYNRVLNQMLLFKKKYSDLEGYELVKKPSAPTPVGEPEKELVEEF